MLTKQLIEKAIRVTRHFAKRAGFSPEYTEWAEYFALEYIARAEKSGTTSPVNNVAKWACARVRYYGSMKKRLAVPPPSKMVYLDGLKEKGNPFELASEQEDPEEVLQRKQERAEIFRLLNTILTDYQREVLFRRYWGGEIQTEIAKDLGTNANAVNSGIQRALSKLREALAA